MKKIEREEVQPILFSILKEFKKYCQKNDLEFFLIGGTLLGAVRHKGFIPWDDDIDVGMMRYQYNKLISVAKQNPYIDRKKRYKILLPLDEGHIYPFIKIVDTKTIAYEKKLNKRYATGLWLDVFPYDYAADTKEEIAKVNKKQKLYKLFLQIGISGELSISQKIKKAFAYPVYKILTQGDYRYWVKKILRLPTSYQTNFVGDVVWLEAEKDMFPIEWFASYVELEFEGEKFKAPKEYEQWLTQFYGDYMKLPKEEDRKVHDPKAYYIDKETENENV